MEQPDRQVLLGQLARRVHRVKLARLAQLVTQDQRARPGLLDQLDKLVERELLALQDHLDLLGRLGIQAPPVQPALLDLLAQRGRQGPRGPRE